MKKALKVLVLLAAVSVFCVPAGAKEFLVCGTSANTGTYYLYGGNWSKVMNSKVPDVDITCEVSGGPTKNLQLIGNGDIDLGFTTGWMAGEAYAGMGVFEGKPTTKAKAMFPMYSSVMYLYALADSPINSLYDLKGKHVITGSPGGTSDKAARALLKALGIEPSQISSLTGNTGANAIKDGMADAGFYVGSVPASFLMNIETTHKIKFIKITDEEFAKIFEAFPFWTKDVMPANTYKNQPDEYSFISFWNYSIAREDLSEKLVYDMVKATFENNETFIATDKNFRTTTTENVSKIVTELHPGAYKYYKEIGVVVPENIIPKK